MSVEKLEQTGALRILLKLLECPRYITELQRTSINTEGVASLDALKTVRFNLGNEGLDLIREEMETGPRPKTFLVITEKGKLVAEKIKEIQEILQA